MILVRLSLDDLDRAEIEGGARTDASVRYRPRYGQPPQQRRWADRLGAVGELAVAIALGIEWEPGAPEEPDFERGDVAGANVRATRHRTGHLFIHERDQDDKRFILVIVEEPWATIVGWLYGAEGKEPIYQRRDKRGSLQYMVPQADLRAFRPRT